MNTVLRILKALRERNKTLSELSREVGVTKPTLLYHLSKLSERGLVKKVQNGNKFVYYFLTEKGRNYIKLLVSLATSRVLSCGLVSLLRNDPYVCSSVSTGLSTIVQKGHTAAVNVCVAVILSFVFYSSTLHCCY